MDCGSGHSDVFTSDGVLGQQSDDCPGLDHSPVTLAGFGRVSGHHDTRTVSRLSGEIDMKSFSYQGECMSAT